MIIESPYHISCNRDYFRRNGDMIFVHPKSWNLSFKVYSHTTVNILDQGKSILLAICDGYNIEIVGRHQTIRFIHNFSHETSNNRWEVTYKPRPDLNLKWFLKACIKQKNSRWEGVS